MLNERAVTMMLMLTALLLPVRGLACQTSADCNDNNPCTDDLCDSTLGCVYSFVSTPCNDGNTCSANDLCNGGTCVGGPVASGCTSCQAIADIPANGGTFVGATSGSGTMSSSCGSTGPSPERVYRWTPNASGTAVIQTCGGGTLYDSVVHVHFGTCGGTEVACNDDTAGCTTGEPNDHHGSYVPLTVSAGQTYVIAVDGYNGSQGTYTLTVTPPSICGNGVREGVEACDGADAAGCATGQCTASCTCVPPAGGLPDLAPAIADVAVAFNTTVADGDVIEGCAESTSGIDLLRFGAYSRNVGTADFVLGDPMCPSPCDQHPLEVCGDPDFICSPAQGHNHPHYNNYARYELLDATGQAVVVGHKQGYCLRDTDCANPVYTCLNQGVTAGCSDLYGSNLGCQYLDITGIPSGTYILRITIDPFDRIVELSESNNVVQQTVTITRPGATATPTRTATRTPTPSTTPTPGGPTTTPGGPTGTPTLSGTPAGTPTPIAGCNITAVIPADGGTVTGTTSGTNRQTGTCGSTGSSPEKLYQWTPTASGTATIRTCGNASLYDTVLYVRGDTCTGQELACNDDTAGCTTGEPNDHHGSAITLNVTAGRTYVIVVDGYAGARGAFTLAVVAPVGATATPTRTATPAATLTATVSPLPTATATPAQATPTTDPTATPGASTVTATATATGTPVTTTTPTDVAPTATATVAAATPTVTATLLATATATATPAATATHTALPTATPTTLPTATLTAVPTATRTATPLPTATRTGTPASTPTRTATPAPTTTPSGVGGCTGAIAIPNEGGTFTGATSGTGTLGATCSYSVPSPENVYRWTAPRSGTALLETCSSVTAFDTILYVRGPSCENGPELSCNDDSAGCGTGEPNDHHGSRVSLSVTAGTTYFIVVDGYAGARGNYQLKVTPP